MDIKATQAELRTFAQQRNWERYHTPKNMAMAMAAEVGELLEIFQWLTPEESVEVSNSTEHSQEVADELADIFIYVLRMADLLDIDLKAATTDKLKKNAEKYPPGPDVPRSAKSDWR